MKLQPLKKKSLISNDIKIRDNEIIPFFSSGSWSLHDLITHCLSYTGKATIKIASFSLSEAALRSFISNKEDNLIHSLYLLFDYTIPKRKFDLMLFAHEVFSEVRLAANHSKIILISGDHNNLAILTSQNLTPNPRIECGAIFTTTFHYQFYLEAFDNFYNNASTFNPFYDGDQK